MRGSTASWLLLLVVGLSGCGDAPPTGGAAAPSTPTPEPEVDEQTLRECPRDDRVWATAVEQAGRREAGLARLRTLAEEIAQVHPERWEPLWAAGDCAYRTGAKDAEALLHQALARAEAVDDPVGIARTTNRLAGVYKKRMDNDAAEREYRKAIAAAERAGRRDLLSSIQSNLAGLLLNLGGLQEALEMLEAARANLGDDVPAVKLRGIDRNRAMLLEALGQFSKARELLEQLREQTEAAGEIQELAGFDVNMGNLLMLLGETAAARESFLRVPAAIAGDHARATLGLGRLALREGRAAEARDHLDRAAAFTEDPGFSLFVETVRGQADLLAGDAAAARAHLAPIAEQAEQKGVHDIPWMARLLFGKALLHEPADAAGALRSFREAVKSIEDQGEGLDPESGGMTYLRERAEPYAELAAALAARGRAADDEVLEIVERAHARALRQILQGSGRSPGTLESAKLRQALGPDELLLDFLIGDERGVVVAVARDALEVARLPGWSALRAPVERYRKKLRRPLISMEARLDPEADLRRDIEVGEALRRTLLGPVEALVARARRLYIVPDQDLALLPFAALPALDAGPSAASAQRFLGDEKEIAVLPMAGAPGRWPQHHTPLLLAGDPLPDPAGELAELPHAAAEMRSVAGVWRDEPQTSVAREELTAEHVRSLPLASFQTLHFATHAVASSRDPERCAVILSRGEQLGLRTIADLELGPALVVLSACRTGEGEVIPGEGVVGLSWAFLSAGARGVVASLWSVQDASTSELMVAFHRQLKAGADPTRALALAQRGLAGTARHPAYWAPFVVILAPGGSPPRGQRTQRPARIGE